MGQQPQAVSCRTGVAWCPTSEGARTIASRSSVHRRRTDSMTTPQDVQQFIGRTAVDSEGNKVGKIGQVYLDERSGLPLWVTVATGMLGTRQSFAPISGSRFDGE